ncbi:hypothetical protein FRB97_003086 [Tulasnella sp. 331]|nr:hypothetical protein FRB97_003086 [Tulasnella sp. 331]KAG8890137.1 hypothetical protein FRB98_000865 [Tulasnella sp. 332]
MYLKVYCKGSPSEPLLIATTKPNHFEFLTAPEASSPGRSPSRRGVSRYETGGQQIVRSYSQYRPDFRRLQSDSVVLGIPISVNKRLWVEGTGGFYLSAGGDDKHIYLVTAQQVVLPLNMDGSNKCERKNDSKAREDVVVFGTSGFYEKLTAIEYEIQDQQRVITDVEEIIELYDDVNDHESIKARGIAEHNLLRA